MKIFAIILLLRSFFHFLSLNFIADFSISFHTPDTFLILENEIDSETLEMMDNMDRVAKLIPKLKYQLLFLKEREKLFKSNDNRSLSNNDSPSVISTDLNSSSSSSDDITMNNSSN